MAKDIDKGLQDLVDAHFTRIKKYQECVKNKCEGKYAPDSGEMSDCMDELCRHYLNASQEFMEERCNRYLNASEEFMGF